MREIFKKELRQETRRFERGQAGTLFRRAGPVEGWQYGFRDWQIKNCRQLIDQRKTKSRRLAGIDCDASVRGLDSRW